VLFVYGTLLPGHLRWPLIEAFAGSTEPARVRGRLYDTGRGYPAARFDQAVVGDECHIEGVVVRFLDDRRDEAWAVVEAIEGDLYERVPVVTTDGLAVESFAWSGAVDGLRLIGPAWTGE
jgi:gamma-glutamylcyclotransferase (GGCT)/AIG2-like uncharacterized protein YtfP